MTPNIAPPEIKSKMPPLNLRDALDTEMVEVTEVSLTLVSGNKVTKKQLRVALNITDRCTFRNDIRAICRGNKDFESMWEEWKMSPYLSATLAVFISQHLFPERKVKLQ